jgi:hypothetical protein
MHFGPILHLDLHPRELMATRHVLVSVLGGIVLVSGGCARNRSAAPAFVSATPSAPRQSQAPEMLAGNVIIRSAPSGPNYEVILDMRFGEAAPDGVPDRVWVLQREPPRRGIRPMRIDGARVYSRSGELIVMPPVGPYAFEFTIGDTSSRPHPFYPQDWREARERFIGDRQIGQRWEGVGLSEHSGRFPLSFAGLFQS